MGGRAQRGGGPPVAARDDAPHGARRNAWRGAPDEEWPWLVRSLQAGLKTHAGRRPRTRTACAAEPEGRDRGRLQRVSRARWSAKRDEGPEACSMWRGATPCAVRASAGARGGSPGRARPPWRRRLVIIGACAAVFVRCAVPFVRGRPRAPSNVVRRSCRTGMVLLAARRA